MKKIIVDIYEQIWDEQGFNPIKNNHLCTVCYESCKDITELSYELRQEILTHKGDGFYAKINEINEFVFIRIELFSDEKYEYIIKYLDTIGSKRSYPDIENNQLEEKLVIVEHLDEKLVEALMMEINKQNNAKKVMQSIKMFERGAGDWRSELVFTLFTGVPIGLFANWITDWMKSKGSDYSRTTVVSDWDVGVVLRKVSELSGINKDGLVITDIEYNGYDEIKYISITNRYADISIQVNALNEIVDYKVDQKSQTRV